jgi:hypothetical protein
VLHYTGKIRQNLYIQRSQYTKKKPLRWVTFCQGGQPDCSAGRKKALKGLSHEMELAFDDMFGKFLA